MGGYKEFAFNLSGKSEDRVVFSIKNSKELKEGDILQSGDYRFSMAFGWVLVEPRLVGTEIPKKPKSWFKRRQAGTGYLRPNKNIEK